MLTIAIQAGGRSSRMGRDKGLVQLNGKPMIEYILDVVHGINAEIIVTTNNFEGYKYLPFRLVSDEKPGLGALPGLLTALKAAKNEKVMVLACDTPFIKPELLARLIHISHQGDVIVPFWRGQYQPMHAIYHKKTCIPAIQKSLEDNNFKMISFYPIVNVVELPQETIEIFDQSGLSFFNINTPEDLQEAEKLLGK